MLDAKQAGATNTDGKALRANSDETLSYAPDTLGKQESQSWQKTK